MHARVHTRTHHRPFRHVSARRLHRRLSSSFAANSPSVNPFVSAPKPRCTFARQRLPLSCRYAYPYTCVHEHRVHFPWNNFRITVKTTGVRRFANRSPWDRERRSLAAVMHPWDKFASLEVVGLGDPWGGWVVDVFMVAMHSLNFARQVDTFRVDLVEISLACLEGDANYESFTFLGNENCFSRVPSCWPIKWCIVLVDRSKVDIDTCIVTARFNSLLPETGKISNFDWVILIANRSDV